MEYFSTTTGAARRSCGCLIVGVYMNGKLGIAAADIDAASGGLLSKLIKQGDLSGSIGDCNILPDIDGVRAQRVAIVGLGAKAQFDVRAYRRAIAAATRAIKSSKSKDVVNYLSLEEAGDASLYYRVRYSIESIGNELYSFTQMKSARKKAHTSIRKIGHAVATRAQAAQAARAAEHADAIVGGMSLCRDLGNLPGNVCTPSYLARTAQQMAKQHKNLSARALNETEMKRHKMGALLSVTAGTREPAKLIVMQYKGKPRAKPIVLVGKGVTFDSGGISLKPGAAMDEMKFDMCGAASVIGAMETVAKLQLPINLTVLVPTVENMPGSAATKPGDIVTSMSGQTIEVLNTDAEGRLILCDALTYAKRFNPQLVVDVATLTGACVIALGHHRTAVMSQSDTLAREVLDAGISADDRAWQLPIAEEYSKQLQSNFADFANIGGRDAGAITAACFLAKFADGINWAHLDIAGTAWLSGAKKGASGRPVPLLSELCLIHAGAIK